MAEMKITKRERFEELKVMALGAGREDLAECIDEQIATLDKRAAKAREYKAKKSAAGDELRDRVEAALKDEFLTANEILDIVADGDEEITKAKVVARLTALCKANKAIKTTAKIDKKKIVVYALPGTEIEVRDEEV